MTFPELKDFRLGWVPHYRRVFDHPASIFFKNDIADLASLQMASLSAEREEGYPGFVASIFEIPIDDPIDGIPTSFLKREAVYNILQAPYLELCPKEGRDRSSRGIICTPSTDEVYVKRWGADRFNHNFQRYGVDTVWNWDRDSGLRPCAVYLRHCYLAAKSMGDACFDSFLDDTYLVDRTTTIRRYLEEYPEVLDAVPPPALVGRYSG